MRWLVALLGAGVAGYLLVDREPDAFAASEPPAEPLSSAAEPQLPAAAAPGGQPALYQYLDDSGQVQFASRLDSVPEHLRDDAVPVGF